MTGRKGYSTVLNCRGRLELYEDGGAVFPQFFTEGSKQNDIEEI